MNHDRKRELETVLKGYCEHVPPSVNNGTHNHTLEFKEAVKKGRRVLTSTRSVGESELTSAINNLHRFW